MAGRRSMLRNGAMAIGLAASTLVASCTALAEDPEPETVLIAADLGLTGAGADLAAVYEQALQLRVEQVNQQGLLGDRRLELVVRDNRSDTGMAATNLAELAGDPDVSAIVTGGCDQCVVAAAESINQAGVPVISLAASSAITEPVDERRYLFKLGPAPSDVASTLAGELTLSEVETIGLVTTGDVYGQEGQAAMAEAAEHAGIEVVVSETVTADENRIATAAEALLAYQEEPVFPVTSQDELDDAPGPDAVVMWTPPTIARQMAATLRERDYEGGFFLDPSAADELFLTGEAAAALDGARMVFTETLVIDSVIATSPAKAARKTWFNDYTSREGTYHAYSSFAADAVQVIVDAVNQRDSTDREELRAGLESTQIDGFSGPVRFRLEDHSGLSPQALTAMVAQGDRWRLAAG